VVLTPKTQTFEALSQVSSLDFEELNRLTKLTPTNKILNVNLFIIHILMSTCGCYTFGTETVHAGSFSCFATHAMRAIERLAVQFVILQVRLFRT
jgi:hypothetical protein